MSPTSLGRALLVLAVVAAATGGVLLLIGSAGIRLPFGRLPGDLVWRRGSARVSIPLGTSLVLSVLLTVLLNVAVRVIARR